MTQSPHYPPPPSPYGHARPDLDPLRYVRKASILLWVIGTLGILTGMCVATLLPTLLTTLRETAPSPEYADQIQQLLKQVDDLERGGQINLKDVMFVAGLIYMFVGGVLGVLAFFVRRSKRPAIISAIVLSFLIDGYFLLITVVMLLQFNPCGFVAALAMLVASTLLIYWLFVALNRLNRMAWMADAGAFPSRQRPDNRSYGSPPEYTPPGVHRSQPMRGSFEAPQSPLAEDGVTPQPDSLQAPTDENRQATQPTASPPDASRWPSDPSSISTARPVDNQPRAEVSPPSNAAPSREVAPPAQPPGPPQVHPHPHAPSVGIPPPPDEPTGKYGYATRPTDPPR